ncbi:hypothetical protein PS1_002374 [Malus domestica]
MENNNVPNISTEVAAADEWFATRVLPFIPTTSITVIAVGNEYLIIGDAARNDEKDLNPLDPTALVQAIQNLHLVLIARGLDRKIKAFRQGSTERVPTMLKTKKQLMSSAPWRMEEEAEAEFPKRKLKVTSQPGSTPTMHVTRKKTKRSQDQDNQDSFTEINPELRYSFQRNFQFLQRMFSIDTVVKPLHSTDGKLHFLSQLQVWKQEPSVLAVFQQNS